MKDVFINRLSSFLPNQPISNDEMELYLGMIGDQPSRARALILRNNGIKTRYYALDRNGHRTHTNAQMCALAIEKLLDEKFTKEQIEMLSCGSTSPDVLLPSLASMVLGELKCRPIEIISPEGSCLPGIQGMRYAFMALKLGDASNAVCCGSERLTSLTTADRFAAEAEIIDRLEEDPIVAFDKEFLRWMLSDGAGAALLQTTPNEDALSLRIDWIETRSYSNELPICMHMGAETTEEGTTPYTNMNARDWKPSHFVLRQDVKLLGENIVPIGGRFLLDIVQRRDLDISSIDFFLPHLSSMYFAKKIEEELRLINLPIPRERWFTNLPFVGNIGSAAFIVMLEELMRTKRFQKGQRILIMVPESARFNYGYMHLTVV